MKKKSEPLKNSLNSYSEEIFHPIKWLESLGGFIGNEVNSISALQCEKGKKSIQMTVLAHESMKFKFN